MVEYRGTFFYPENIEESYAQESKYYEDPETGSYMYWFDYKGKKYCIDATAESPYYGRLLNHSCKVPNCATKPLDVRLYDSRVDSTRSHHGGHAQCGDICIKSLIKMC